MEKAKDTGALRELDELAEKIKVSLKKVDDYQVTVACQLADAKKRCKALKKNFEQWLADSAINLSVDYADKLATAGAKDDPRKAIEDMRAGTRKRVAAHRAKQKEVLRNTLEKSPTPKPKENSLFQKLDVLIEQVGPEGEKRLLESRAAKYGLVLLSSTKANGADKPDETREAMEARGVYLAWLDKQPREKRVDEIRHLFYVAKLSIRDLAVETFDLAKSASKTIAKPKARSKTQKKQQVTTQNEAQSNVS